LAALAYAEPPIATASEPVAIAAEEADTTLMYFEEFATSLLSPRITVSTPPRADPTSLYVLPCTVYVGLVTAPVALTLEPPPSAFATLLAVLYSCEPFTASLLLEVT
jgi:hypothetical protein